MNLEYFIARRSEQERHHQEPSVMMRVATVAVALGIVVMIITIAVIGGFKSQINTKLSGLSGHIVLSHTRGVDTSGGRYITMDESLESLLEEEGLTRYSSFITRGAIARGGELIEGVMVKGVDSLYNREFFQSYITQGEAPHFTKPSSRRELLISKELSDDMQLNIGDRLELLFSGEDGDMERLTFKVAGVFSAGVGEAEKQMIIADIATLRRVNGWAEDQISGVEIWLNRADEASNIAEILNKKIIFGAEKQLDNVGAQSLEELYPSLYDWMRTHDVNGVVVITIMLIVALFNMTTALLILVLERTQMIGILKSLGMGNGALRKIFLYRAFAVTLRGLVWGNGVAIALCLVQQRWGILKLEASGYMLSEVPIELSVGWIMALNVAAVAVILVVMILPTRIVATISPDEIVKYK